jgi:hypothetical protein
VAGAVRHPDADCGDPLTISGEDIHSTFSDPLPLWVGNETTSNQSVPRSRMRRSTSARVSSIIRCRRGNSCVSPDLAMQFLGGMFDLIGDFLVDPHFQYFDALSLLRLHTDVHTEVQTGICTSIRTDRQTADTVISMIPGSTWRIGTRCCNNKAIIIVQSYMVYVHVVL